MQKFSYLLQEKHFQTKGWIDGELEKCAFSNGKVRKMCVFQRQTGYISEKVRDRAKVAIDH